LGENAEEFRVGLAPQGMKELRTGSLANTEPVLGKGADLCAGDHTVTLCQRDLEITHRDSL
jgi:hypothetical protein